MQRHKTRYTNTETIYFIGCYFVLAFSELAFGNVRLSYSDANKNDKIDVGEIIEETNYYPFGLAHQGYNEKNNTIAQNYKYQYIIEEKAQLWTKIPHAVQRISRRIRIEFV